MQKLCIIVTGMKDRLIMCNKLNFLPQLSGIFEVSKATLNCIFCAQTLGELQCFLSHWCSLCISECGPRLTLNAYCFWSDISLLPLKKQCTTAFSARILLCYLSVSVLVSRDLYTDVNITLLSTHVPKWGLCVPPRILKGLWPTTASASGCKIQMLIKVR